MLSIWIGQTFGCLVKGSNLMLHVCLWSLLSPIMIDHHIVTLNHTIRTFNDLNPLPDKPVLGLPIEQQIKIDCKNMDEWGSLSDKSGKHCGKRRNCSVRVISPFPTMFSKTGCR